MKDKLKLEALMDSASDAEFDAEFAEMDKEIQQMNNVSFDGKSQRVQMNEGSSSPSYEVGDEVVVLYEPEHPLDVRIKSVGSSAMMWILPGITGILGIAFLGAVLLVRRLMPSTELRS